MRWSELPQGYRDLKSNFQKDIYFSEDMDNLSMKFVWEKTNVFKDSRNSHKFWLMCYEAKNTSQLPDIPKVGENQNCPFFFVTFWKGSCY